MSKSSDEIRRDIERDREDAAAKIDQLEQQLYDTADEAKQQAQDAVTDIRAEAEEMLHDTVETVKENIDIQQQVQDHPLPAVAAALVGGFLLGSMMSDDGGGHSGGESFGSTIRRTAEDSGLIETAENMAAAFIGSVTEEFKGRVMPTK